MKPLKHGKKKTTIRLSETGWELLAGELIYYVIGQIIILVLTDSKIYDTIGFVLGVLISVCMTIHMTISLEQAMCMGERGALKHVRISSGIRLVMVFLAMVIAAVFNIGNIFAVIVGVFALKVSAYIQPFTHKVLEKKSTEKGG